MCTINEAIDKMGCKNKLCSFLDVDGKYTFCKALRTDDFCLKKDKKEENGKNKTDVKK